MAIKQLMRHTCLRQLEEAGISPLRAGKELVPEGCRHVGPGGSKSRGDIGAGTGKVACLQLQRSITLALTPRTSGG